MKRTKKNWAILPAAIAASALLFTGCATDASADSKTESAEANGISTVEAGIFTCSMSGEYRPFNYFDDAATLVGFDVDMCVAIAEELGLEANPVTAPFNSLIAGLQANRADAIIGSLAVTEEREKQVLFSESYYETGASLFVQEDSKTVSIDELDDAVIGVTLGTTFEEFARGLDNVKEVKTYQADADALNDLQTGRIDGVITQGFLGNYLAKNAGLKVKEVGDVLIPDVAAIAVHKDNPELRDAINKALTTLRDNGTYDALGIEWFGQPLS